MASGVAIVSNKKSTKRFGGVKCTRSNPATLLLEECNKCVSWGGRVLLCCNVTAADWGAIVASGTGGVIQWCLLPLLFANFCTKNEARGDQMSRFGAKNEISEQAPSLVFFDFCEPRGRVEDETRSRMSLLMLSSFVSRPLGDNWRWKNNEAFPAPFHHGPPILAVSKKKVHWRKWNRASCHWLKIK